jgi:quercetin dioxygenase-like cupin family protein
MRAIPAIATALILSSAKAPAPAPPAFDVRVPVPDNAGPQDIEVLQREFPVGGSSGWHVHPGIEIAYVLSGEMELRAKGQPPRRMRTGDHFVMPRGMEHNGINIGKGAARVAITYIVDRGAPVRTAVAAPN